MLWSPLLLHRDLEIIKKAIVENKPKIIVLGITLVSFGSGFYSASALLAMQSAVLARGIPFVCLSVTLNDLERRNGHYFALFRGIR